MLWFFVGIVDSGKTLNFATAGLGVKALRVTGFADLKRRVDKHLYKLLRSHHVTDVVAGGVLARPRVTSFSLRVAR